MLVLKTEGLTKEFRTGFWQTRVRVLHDLNLEVRQGEIFGYLGPNGAGKTTTMNLLMGLIHPTAGRAWILGRDVSDVAVKAEVGFLPENPYFYHYLSGREFLDFYGQLFGLPSGERRRRIEELLHVVGMSHAAGLQLRKYSKGMLQRIGLAQALINDPQAVFLDEPMSGLDPVGRKEVRDLILDLKGRGKTVFFSTHIIPDVEMICDRVGIIVNGRLIRVGPLEELLGSEVECIEITASGLDEAAWVEIGRWSVRPPVRRGDKVFFAVGTEQEATRVVELLLKMGASIHAILPHRLTLEEHFLREVAGREQSRGASPEQGRGGGA
ncbi:MAG: ABC transporter ATP-binding protein [Candidatus Methylomirabilales bacterium]